jgi:hypothetical protein
MNPYDVVKKFPVAKFYYKGHHSHPVRRTVLIIRTTTNYICGYELREGSVVRKFKNAPIKSYRRGRIATLSQLRNKVPNSANSTLKRGKLIELIQNGA